MHLINIYARYARSGRLGSRACRVGQVNPDYASQRP